MLLLGLVAGLAHQLLPQHVIFCMPGRPRLEHVFDSSQHSASYLTVMLASRLTLLAFPVAHIWQCSGQGTAGCLAILVYRE